MLANQPYDPISLLQFNVSMLSLAAALDLPAPIGTKEESKVALVEAQQLKLSVSRHQK